MAESALCITMYRESSGWTATATSPGNVSGLVVPTTTSASEDKIQALKVGPRPHPTLLTKLKPEELAKGGDRDGQS